ncbi:hypothetical protein HY633_03800 [Candidatus Uhrbacteria bacterium]|nr:hypothetical protein [Candidatus Uhrbacteria bacterium]
MDRSDKATGTAKTAKRRAAKDQNKKPMTPMAPSQQQPSQFFDEGVRLISYCPLCESSYDPREARVLGEKEDSHLLHIQCGNCSNAIIALVLISSVGVSSVGLVTDLSYDDVQRFRKVGSVSTDDVIEVHGAMQDEDMFFKRLVI